MRVQTKLTPFTKNFTREIGEYYGLKADKDICDLLGDPEARLLFTEHQIKVAYERWVREGRPKFVTEEDRLNALVNVKNTIIRDLRYELKKVKEELREEKRRPWWRRLFG